MDVVGDMRRSFWQLERRNERFQRSLTQAHSNFFKSIMPGKRRGAQQDEPIKRSKLLREKLGIRVKQRPVVLGEQRQEISEREGKRVEDDVSWFKDLFNDEEAAKQT